ncbi:MAG: 3-deoxy-7-phosphoheptulonate synthase [Chloroflexi bacterium HGW-Chloroflexi-6]|nr:MAG: 3-deoxy-7-phosphoheptulonate synthase [Chloroflexi bacterium HGW-Chloroflexi-6]
MMIIMKTEASEVEVAGAITMVEEHGLRAHIVHGAERNVIGVVGDIRRIDREVVALLPGVDHVMSISRPYKLASREFQKENTVFNINGVKVGSNEILIIAGPCSVESRTQMLEIAQAVREAGAHALRGGAFKPRSSPYAFQGMGEAGLELLAEARELTGMPIVTEVMAPDQVDLVAKFADVLQIGARNMQNFNLLHAVGKTERAVLLKRGMAATVEDLLMAAEYVISNGNRRIMLCERGIRTFETSTRNTTDINAVPVLKAQTHLPIFLDPSHSTGKTEYVTAIARAAIAAGADGLIVEVHPHPEQAVSDGAQSYKPEQFADMVKQVRAIAEVMGRKVPQHEVTL